jgi:hypothetical protein
MDENEPRANLDRLITNNREDYASLSKLVGRNAAYIQQFIKRGSPKRLGERERGILARYFGVDEALLGAPKVPGRRRDGLRLVPKLRIEASAGSGALTDVEALAGQVGFDENWLKKMGCEPAQLSLIRVSGDSMVPTLVDGDDIMVDRGAANRPLRDGIYVIRMDDVLMVKRLAKGPSGTVSVLSDNPVYPDWSNVDGIEITIIGRVVWVSRRV